MKNFFIFALLIIRLVTIRQNIYASCEHAFAYNKVSDKPCSIGANLFNMKLIELSKHGYLKNRGKYFAKVDDEDFEMLMKYKWSVRKQTHTIYAQDSATAKPMTRFLFNVPDGMVVDHIDGDGLNNQKHNLRVCTPDQNSLNLTKTRGLKTHSKYKGVSASRGYWSASICLQHKSHFLGRFKTELEAAIAYNEKAKELHGEFAKLNTIIYGL